MKTEPNFPAFPTIPENSCDGLTKRELLSAMAMQGIAANPDISKAAMQAGVKPSDLRLSIAIASVKMADELITTLNSPTP